MDNQNRSDGYPYMAGGNGRSMSVYITTANEEFVKEEAKKNQERGFSTALNKIIDARRYNEQFNSCQDKF